MLAAIISMWASTLVYWINALWRAKKIYFVLLSYLSTEPDKYSGADFDEIVVAFFGGGCVGNAVMTVNVSHSIRCGFVAHSDRMYFFE